MLYCLNSSRISLMPPPKYIQAFCWRAVRPKGTAQSKAKAMFLPT
jgi:hypothetical protein